MNEETSAIARRYAEEAGVADRIEYRLGPALETLAGLEGPFDLVFIDARKDEYAGYYEAVLPLLAEGGVILADNTLFGMREGHPLETFNRHVPRRPARRVRPADAPRGRDADPEAALAGDRSRR